MTKHTFENTTGTSAVRVNTKLVANATSAVVGGVWAAGVSILKASAVAALNSDMDVIKKGIENNPVSTFKDSKTYVYKKADQAIEAISREVEDAFKETTEK